MNAEMPDSIPTVTAEERRYIARLLGKQRGNWRRLNPDAPLPLEPDGYLMLDLLAALANTNDAAWRKRAIAAWTMGVIEIPQGERERVVSLLRSVLTDRRRQSLGERTLQRCFNAGYRTFRVMFWIILLSSSLQAAFLPEISILLRLMMVLLKSLTGALSTAIFITPFVLPFSIRHDKEKNAEARALAARSLKRLNAVEAIRDILIHALDRAPSIHRESRDALRVLLPQLSEQDRALLPLNAESLLGKILHRSSEPILVEVILDQLEQWGQGAALLSVADFLKKFSRNVVSRFSVPIEGEIPVEMRESLRRMQDAEQRIADKAHRVHTLLLERQAQASARTELLRHSTAPKADSDQLLRAAHASAETQPETLLRAAVPTAREETALLEERR
jgi:hypothetical protein